MSLIISFVEIRATVACEEAYKTRTFEFWPNRLDPPPNQRSISKRFINNMDLRDASASKKSNFLGNWSFLYWAKVTTLGLNASQITVIHYKYSNTVIHYKYNNMNTVQRYRKSWLVKSLTLSTISWQFRQHNIFWKYGILEFEMVLFEKTFPNILWWNGCCCIASSKHLAF